MKHFKKFFQSATLANKKIWKPFNKEGQEEHPKNNLLGNTKVLESIRKISQTFWRKQKKEWPGDFPRILTDLFSKFSQLFKTGQLSFEHTLPGEMQKRPEFFQSFLTEKTRNVMRVDPRRILSQKQLTLSKCLMTYWTQTQTYHFTEFSVQRKIFCCRSSFSFSGICFDFSICEFRLKIIFSGTYSIH